LLDADAVRDLRTSLSPAQWRLLLKVGLCIGCELALRQGDRSQLLEDDEEDYGRPFPEETR